MKITYHWQLEQLTKIDLRLIAGILRRGKEEQENLYTTKKKKAYISFS